MHHESISKNLAIWSKQPISRILVSSDKVGGYQNAIQCAILSGSSVGLFVGTDDCLAHLTKTAAGFRLSHSIDTGDAPAETLHKDDVYLIARAPIHAVHYSPKCTFYVILVDPNLSVLKTIPPDLKKHLAKHSVLLVCDFIEPEQSELANHIANSIFGTLDDFHFFSSTRLAVPPIECTLSAQPVEASNPMMQIAKKKTENPHETLHCINLAHAYKVEHDLVITSPRMILVCENTKYEDLAKRMIRRTTHKDVIILEKSDICKNSFAFSPNTITQYTVLFLPSFLNAYDERVVLSRLIAGGIGVESAKSISFSTEIYNLRSDAWSKLDSEEAKCVVASFVQYK